MADMEAKEESTKESSENDTGNACVSQPTFDSESSEEKNNNEDDLLGEYEVKINPQESNDEKQSKLGRVYIFNNKDFKNEKARLGSEKDVDDLDKIFKKFGFEVFLHIDLTMVEFIEKVQAAATYNYDAYKTLICVFMSHGLEGQISLSDGSLSTDLIFRECMDNASLAGKPKIFIFQTCQGRRDNYPIEKQGKGKRKNSEDSDANSEEEIEDDGLTDKVPQGADTVTAFATTRGFKARRHPGKGSRFIRVLVSVLTDYKAGKYDKHNLDFIQLLTLVSKKVASEDHQGKPMQMPCFFSTFRKRLFLPK